MPVIGFACWGILICRLAQGSWDFGKYDGVAIRVRGDGQTLKFNMKTTEQAGDSDNTYQAVFDTVPGKHLPAEKALFPTLALQY